MRQDKPFFLTPEHIEPFAEKALEWALQEEEYLAYYTSCGISYPYDAFTHLLAVGALDNPVLGEAPFSVLEALHQQAPDWRFGYFSYELKNRIHQLGSKNSGSLNFPYCQFFRPKHLLLFTTNGVSISSADDPQLIFDAIQKIVLSPELLPSGTTITASMNKKEYLQKVMHIKEHILEGDCYELNLCIEFRAEGFREDPLQLFRMLKRRSPAPFTCFQRFGQQYLISASPERFLKKEKDLLISQPIKGTSKRGNSADEDALLKQLLSASEKDRAENLMIVDLVRNDLARSCQWGSVAVPELFGIYSFRHVHQMISTIIGTLRPEVAFTEAIKMAFPMGSMTGAPKRIVMELIDKYETAQRGLYSGAAGYITPAGDFDFNVVIRSMLYDATQQRLTFSAGGAITWDSDPEQEYQECILKAKAILEILRTTIPEE